MAKSKTDILTEAEIYIRQWYQREMPPEMVFHSFHHTRELVKTVKKLAEKENLDGPSVELLTLAGWFQYTGLGTGRKAYRDESVQIAKTFLSNQEYDSEATEKILELIRSTALDREPNNHLEQILYDANYFFLGTKDFETKAKLLRVERENLRGEQYTEKEWSDKLQQLMLNHNFYTPWAQKKYGKRKLKNLAKQKDIAVKARERTLKKKTGKNIGRAVDTLYRTNFRNHINLSQIADGKANMMISINTIVLSIVIAVSSAGLGFVEDFLLQNIAYLLPIMVLLLSSVTALVFAVFSAKPTVTSYSLTEEEINSSKVNLLYFGNFLQMEKEDFVSYLSELKKDQNRLYDDLARDLYNLGLVLKKKYRLLSLSYNIFVGGLVCSVLIMILIFIFKF